MAANGYLGYTKMAKTSHWFADRRDVWFFVGVSS